MSFDRPSTSTSKGPRAGRRWRIAALAVALPALVSSAALAAVGPDLEAAGWRELANPNKAENTYTVGAGGTIEVASRNSVSTLYKPIRADIDARPILAWRWRVDEAAPATDLSKKGEDDCSLALYVGFPYESGQASFFERMKRPLVEAMAGENAPGRVLRYVFCGAHEQGEVVPSPHLGSAGSMHVLRPGNSPSGTWFEERVDLAADFRAAFGTEPSDPSQIAIQADTDDTGSSSRASVADITFLSPDEAGPAPRQG